MTITEAQNIANEYLSKLDKPLPGFLWGLGVAEEIYNKYYFDLHLIANNKEKQLEAPVGGARGIIVDRNNKEVKIISHGEFASLQRNQRELDSIYNAFTLLKHDRKNLIVIKSKYKLSSVQLLKLIKELNSAELDREEIFNTISELIKKVKYS